MRKNRTPTPHDLVFKTFLSTMETARDFIAIHLPPALLQLCDLQTLQLESGSFIEEDLHPYCGQQVIALVNYMLQAGEAQDAHTLLYEMAQRAPQYGDELMTLAEQLKQEGRNEGIQQGMQQGIQTGEREASRKIARAMLDKGIPAADIIEMTGVSAEELPSLQH
ncbi:hypothetical protein CEW81_21045 [Kluyvera genomosp. 3]|uniref:Transposase (putative) YhgA-like domain-containing protein n=1 Tax=Kluyvera genomosp. 3 TaxID=2774055 RepID=A0A248KKH4_9ENTR|nr:hypothetical protein CEW81_21045 [Kluyvera genomosp. 3]